MQLHQVEFIKTHCNVQILCLTLQSLTSDIHDGHLMDGTVIQIPVRCTSDWAFNPYPTAFPYGNGMVLHFYQQQESSTTKTVHKVINKGLKAYV